MQEIHKYLTQNKLFHLGEDRPYFQDKNENRAYFFNKMFIQYLIEFTRDVKILFEIKKEELVPVKYVQQICDEKFGFEGLHYFLNRISFVHRILYLLAKLELGDKIVQVYEYIFEALSQQLFIEYTFVKECLQELIEIY